MAVILLLGLIQVGPPIQESSWFPEGLLYRHPLADPRAPVTGVRFQFPLEKSDDFKNESVLGTHLAVFRRGDRDIGLEIQAEGAAFARFDFTENWDMDGADFRFGFPIAYLAGSIALKLHPWHMTSHLGDEFIERTGRKRIVYARNEIALGGSWDVDQEWRVYVEAGYAFERGDVNEPMRVMAGVETVGRHLGPDWPEVFGGINLTTYEETDWGIQFASEVGVRLRPEGSNRGIRLGVGYFRGHSALTQFFDEREEYWTFGFALPL